MNLTYNTLKTVIRNGKYISKEDIIQKMDIFLIGNRITQEQYNELLDTLNAA